MEKKSNPKTHILLRMRTLIVAIAVIIFPIAVSADNPVIPSNSISTADPAPHVFDDVLYLYCTQDNDASLAITNIRCWSTTDLVNWEDHGVVLAEEDVAWAQKVPGGHLWAPHVAFIDGKYHMYFPETAQNGTFYIGHATCSTPNGTFTADAQQMLINGRRSGTLYTENGLDPCVFEDGDTWYLAWCITGITPNRNYIGPLNAAADEVVGEPHQFTNSKFYPNDGLGHYVEAQNFIKHNNTWYHIYAVYYPGNEEQIGVSTSSELMGDYTFRGFLMGHPVQSAAGTKHPGVIFFKDKWHLFWHCGGEEYGGSLLPQRALRSSAAEYFTFNDNTNPPAIVSPLTPNDNWSIPETYRGVGIPTYGDEIHVDRRSRSSDINGASIAVVGGGEPAGHMVTRIGNNGWVRYDSVDFKDGGCMGAEIRVAASGSGSIEFRLGSNSGTLVGTAEYQSTGGLSNWETQESEWTPEPSATGVKNLVCVFKGGVNQLNVNWVKLWGDTTSGINSDPPSPMKGMKAPGYSYQRVNKNTFKITIANQAPIPKIKLFDMKGKEIPRAITFKFLNERHFQVNIKTNALSSGSYILLVDSRDGKHKIPFVYK